MDIATLNQLQTVFNLFQTISSIITEIPILWNNHQEPQIIFHYDFPIWAIDRANTIAKNQFPQDFYFGTSTSAYQTEGAWNESDKGQSIWDHMTHTRPDLIKDQSNADVSSDSYHKYKEDIQLAKKIGSTMSGLSLSWSRILPNGYKHYLSKDGIQYYDNVINEMITNGITPVVTLFHWDMPYQLQQIGGFTNPLIVEYFNDYAKTAFKAFGDRVKHWVTFNEPQTLCKDGYGHGIIPALNQSGITDYICMHYVLLAHAKAYHTYDLGFRKSQKGKIGININYSWMEAQNKTSKRDRKALERAFEWCHGWITAPIFHMFGDYPIEMKKRVILLSSMQGSMRSRLPEFTESEVLDIKGSSDFLGVNYYPTKLISSIPDETDNISFYNDARFKENSFNWTDELTSNNTPTALELLLRRLIRDYEIPEIYITVNGYEDFGGVNDYARTIYYYQHLNQLLRIMQDGVYIKSYFISPLLDGFEWMNGYTVKRGVYQVDFNDSNRTRTAKLSTKVVSAVYRNKKVDHLEQIIQDPTVREALKNLSMNSH